jgi:hypothetical protein
MWTPNKHHVSVKELVGRRVFQESPFFERNGKRRVKLNVFLDERPDQDGLSFDRLGVRPRDFMEVVQVLTPIAKAEAASRKPPRPFPGWLGIRVNDIKDLCLKPDPITDDPKNPFHAILPLNCYRDAIHANNLAHRLALAAEDGSLVPPCDQSSPPPSQGGSFRLSKLFWNGVRIRVNQLLTSLSWK